MAIARPLFSLACVLIAPSTLLAQSQPDPGTVRVRVLDQSNIELATHDYPTGTNVAVALAAMPTARTVHIFSVNTLNQWGNHAPDGGLGTLTITGGTSSIERLNLLIADGDEVFPANGDTAAADFLHPGLTTFGGGWPGQTA